MPLRRSFGEHHMHSLPMKPKSKLPQPPNLTLRGYIASKLGANALRGAPVPPYRAQSSVGWLLQDAQFRHAAMDDDLMDISTSGYRIFLLLESYGSKYSYRDIFCILDCIRCERELLSAKNIDVKAPPILKTLRYGDFPETDIVTLGCCKQICSECLT